MPDRSQDPPVSVELFTRAQVVTPGGVNSPVRAFKSVGGTPRFMVSGSGPYLTDADGRRYVDLVSSWGPMILGHAHPAVVEAVQRAATFGLSFGTPTLGEIELAEELIRRIAPVQQVRLVNSGTEATMSAIRLARGFTGRRLVVKFAGCYHGHVDALLAAAGSGVVTLGLPDTPWRDWCADGRDDRAAVQRRGRGARLLRRVRQRDRLPDHRGGGREHGRSASAAGVSTRRCGRSPPRTARLLIMDEVMTGFRVSAAGWYGLEPVDADLFTFGKVMSGGLPAAAFGGRADVMSRLAPVGPVYQAGTLSGNPVAVAAGLATLRATGPEVYAALDANARMVGRLASDALTEAGVEHQLQYAGNLFSIFFSEDAVHDFAGAQAAATWRYKAFFHSMLDSGVYLPPSAFEAWFVNAAMDDEAIGRIAEALPAAARAAAESVAP